jgi:hypothetical protein
MQQTPLNKNATFSITAKNAKLSKTIINVTFRAIQEMQSLA